MKKLTKNNGFTLFEAMLALVILSIATAGILLPFSSSLAVQQQGYKQTLAVKLASNLMERIAASDYEDIIDDYGDYREEQGQILSATGGVLTDSIYSDLSRTASCEYVYMPQQSNYGSPNFIRIKVSVYQSSTKLAEIVRLKCK